MRRDTFDEIGETIQPVDRGGEEVPNRLREDESR
jgi:hypothetical protein